MKKDNNKFCVKDDEPPPVYDTFPTSMKIRTDPITNVTIPSDEAVSEVKRWSETNQK